MTYHIIVGDMAAQPLLKTFNDTNTHSVLVLKDLLQLGPLQKAEGQSFTDLRKSFWAKLLASDTTTVQLQDMEQVLELSKNMHADKEIKTIFWMAALPADVCAYYWLLFYMSKYPSQFYVINIAGLPFLNENGKLFFPKSIAELNEKEILKAEKLARTISASEYETDLYEWQQIIQNASELRDVRVSKKIEHLTIDAYDKYLLQCCSPQFQKASKIIHTAIGKDLKLTTGDVFLAWRLKELCSLGQIETNVEPTKNQKEIEYRLIQTAQQNSTENV